MIKKTKIPIIQKNDGNHCTINLGLSAKKVDLKSINKLKYFYNLF